MREFSTAGPIKPKRHYHVPPLSRLDIDEILALIHGEKYFVLHAPRQTGKTSILLALADLLNRSGNCRCVYADFQAGRAAGEDTARAMRSLLDELGASAEEMLQDDFVDSVATAMLERAGPDRALQRTLRAWSARSAKPLVLLIDEFDALVGRTLISVLTQLRSG